MEFIRPDTKLSKCIKDGWNRKGHKLCCTVCLPFVEDNRRLIAWTVECLVQAGSKKLSKHEKHFQFLFGGGYDSLFCCKTKTGNDTHTCDMMIYKLSLDPP